MRRIPFIFVFGILIFPGIVYGASFSPSVRATLLLLLQRVSLYSKPIPIVSTSRITSTSTPVITALSPTRGVSGTEIVIQGKGFTASNTVHTIFESRYGVPAQKNGTEIRFIHRYPPVVQTEAEILSTLSSWGMSLGASGSPQNPVHGNTQDVFLYIHNENGDSNTATFIEQLNP